MYQISVTDFEHGFNYVSKSRIKERDHLESAITAYTRACQHYYYLHKEREEENELEGTFKIVVLYGVNGEMLASETYEL